MIDLNRKSTPKQEEPAGLVILGVMPFCLMILWGIVHAL